MSDAKVTGKRGTGTESMGPSIARSGLSVESDSLRSLPDPLKVAKGEANSQHTSGRLRGLSEINTNLTSKISHFIRKLAAYSQEEIVANEGETPQGPAVRDFNDIRDQLKETQIPYPIKNRIVMLTKDVETMINCNKYFGPYLRRGLVDLRQCIKKKWKLPEDQQAHVLEQFYRFRELFEKIKAKKYEIIEAAEAKKVAIDRKRKLLQVFVDDNIRICSTDRVVDLTSKMGEVQKFKRLIKEIDKIGSARNFTPELKEELSDMTQYIYNMLALDGVSALKARHEVVLLRNAVVKGPDAEDEIKNRLRLMKANVMSITNHCENRRDHTENYVNDVTKMMLDMDREINEKTALLHAQATGKDPKQKQTK